MSSRYESLKWIWFDLDDTLVDFEANSLAALKDVYHRYNLNRCFPTMQQWIDCYHHHNKLLWEQYNAGEIDQPFLRMERFRRPLCDFGMADAKARQLSVQLDPAYLDTLARGKAVMPDCDTVLSRLREKGYKIGILSNGFNGVQQKKVKSAGLEHLVDLIVLSDDISVNKPDVRLYRHAQSRSGEENPAAHLMVGDNPATDIAGAINAGWSAILFTPRDPHPAAADYPITGKLIDVLRIIEQ